MIFDRNDLLTRLKLVAPALSPRSFLATEACLYFDRRQVWASSGGMCFRCDCVTDFDCGVAGAPLMALLSSSEAHQVELTVSDGEMYIKMGRTGGHLAVQSVWHPPTEELPPDELVLRDFVAGIGLVIECAGSDAMSPSRLGIAVYFGANYFEMFATNNILMGKAAIATAVPPHLVGRTIQIPNALGKVILKYGISEEGRLRIGAKLLELRSDSLCVIGGLLADADIVGYREQIDQIDERAPGSKAVISDDLRRALQRAAVVATEDFQTVLQAESGRLLIHTASSVGEVADKILCDAIDYKCAIRAPTSFLVSAMADMATFSVQKECVTFYTDLGRRFVSVGAV